jgi:hypothetical protein
MAKCPTCKGRRKLQGSYDDERLCKICNGGWTPQQGLCVGCGGSKRYTVRQSRDINCQTCRGTGEIPDPRPVSKPSSKSTGTKPGSSRSKSTTLDVPLSLRAGLLGGLLGFAVGFVFAPEENRTTVAWIGAAISAVIFAQYWRIIAAWTVLAAIVVGVLYYHTPNGNGWQALMSDLYALFEQFKR